MENSLPKVLIISRGVWDDTQGTSSTLTNIFEDYDPEKLAHIYIETKRPNTRCCYRFFQISEYSLVQKLWKWGLKTGHAFDTREDDIQVTSDEIAEKEASTMDFVREHRSLSYSTMREVLWGFNGWKSDDLKRFILDFSPDVIWMDGSPLPFMYRLYDYVLKVARRPGSIFMQDDVYTYKSIAGGLWRRCRKWHLRRSVRHVVAQCTNMFVASPKMKQEYDELFDVDSIFIAKSFRMGEDGFKQTNVHKPLRLVYMGQVLYGRINTLISIADTLSEINGEDTKIELYIYTNNVIGEEDKVHLLRNGHVFLKEPVPYSDVPRVISENDVVVFVETFDKRLNKIARLSFSTKISDYLRSGKCVFAIGPSDVAPIEYFVDNDAAIVATSTDDIKTCLEKLSDAVLVNDYAAKAHACARSFHNRENMNKIIYGRLTEIANRR